jgi:RimJ/RimL family protein N-acetyltransferase
MRASADITLFETGRLRFREMTEADGGFYLAMLSDPDFKTHIGDRGVTTEEQAIANLQERVFSSYDVHDFGMWLVCRKRDGAAIGMAGLVKRDFLKNVDLGYAFLPAGRGAGYATEAAAAVIDYAGSRFGIRRLAAIVSPDNSASIRVLERLGFDRTGQVRFPDDGDLCEHFLLDTRRHSPRWQPGRG